jgi:hypothetical protein
MWSLLLVSALTLAPPDFEVRLLGGEAVTGPIGQLDADRLTVQTADGPVSLETEDITGLSRPSPPRPPDVQSAVRVELADGSRLVAAEYSVRDGLATILGPRGRITEVPTRDLSAVRLGPQTDAAAAEWSRILESDLDGDLLVIRKTESLDYHRGVLGDVSDTVVRFELDGELLPVKRAKVHGLVYHRAADRSLPDAVCSITDADGSRWQARSIRLDGDLLRWSTPSGLEITCPSQEVVRIDFSQGKIVYLSDLEPESIEWTPYFGSPQQLPALAQLFAPRTDRGLEPGPLLLDGKPYQKGLALHSRTSLVYRLPGRFRRFKATAGVDDRVRPRGNVRLLIHGDERLLVETTITGTDPPQQLDLDLTGVRRLAILVDFGDDLDVADHLDLCDARVVK